MSAQIVNLRQARKNRARAAKEAEAEANRARFGRRLVEREHEAAERERAAREHDGKEIER